VQDLVMPVQFVHGDLFAARELDALAHGCNCAGAMGKGIAVELHARFPAMYAEYKRRCAAGRFQLGDVFEWDEGPLTVYNLGTQKTWRTKAQLADVERALATMIEVAERRGIERIGLPRIGAGLGGLPWAQVKARIEALAAATAIELVVFESFGAPAANDAE
jgi:O-acetyl-ADP-ribose deacetylase (regulator of RNase III)